MKDQEFEYNPYEKSDFVSRIFFTWCLKKFRNISKKGLFINTLFKVTSDQDSDLLGIKLYTEWKGEIKQAALKHRKPSLYNVLSKMFIFNKENWLVLMWFLINYIIIRSSQAATTAALVQKLLYPLNDGFEFATQCVLAGLLTVIVIINALITNYCLYRQLISGIRLRTALTNLIFRKIMKLDNNILTKIENVEVINFTTLDMMDIDFLPMSIHYLFLLPVVIVEIYLMIYLYFNEAAIVSIGVFALSFPFQCLCCSWVYTINRSVEKHTQRKISIISTMLKYIYTIKVYGLEKLFAEKIWRVRKSKNKINGFNYFVRFLYKITLETTQRMAVFATVFFFVYSCYVLTIEKIVLCLVILVDFGQTLIHNIPESIALVSNSKKFLKDIQKFLLLEEQKPSEFILKEGNIIFENVSASKHSSILNDLNITIPSGKLSLITGTNLSGHNLIIPILLGELPYKGNVVCTGTFAYYHTHPIIISGSIKENITLGKLFSRKKYKAAVKTAGLKADILKLPYKEDTDIHEADFSFLQKTKLNLARILYSNADIYLFLFPIIDIHNYVTARSSLIDCITKYLHNKTRIVVSNQLVFTECADVIFYMNKGRCEHFGSFNELQKLFPTMNEIMIADIDRRSSALFNNSTGSKPDMKMVNSKSVQVFTDIKTSHNNPRRNIIKAYMTGWKLKNSMYICIIITCIASFFCIAADYYIYNCADSWMKMFYTPEIISTFHAHKMDEPFFNKTDNWLKEEIENTTNDLINYTIIILLLLFFQVTRVLVCLVIFERASKKIFAHLMSAVMNSRLYFFVTTCNDDILELFGRDIKVIDVNIPINVMDSVQVAVLILTICGFIIALKALFILSVLIFALLFYVFVNWFLKTNTCIRAIEQQVISMISLYVSTTTKALTIIRINHATSHFLQKFTYYQNLHTSIRCLVHTLHASFTLWVSITSMLFSIMVMVNHVILEKYFNMRIQWTGLVIAHTMFIKDIIIMVFRHFGHFSYNLTSIDNVLNYSNVKTKREIFHTKFDQELVNWPSKGKIEFRKVSIIFPDMPSLYNINFIIESGQKICIIGSPGSGKTLIAMLLLKLYQFDGLIQVDDVDIAKVGVVLLRKKITFLSEHIMFLKGSLRSQLDPYSEYPDSKLLEVIEAVHLTEVMKEIPNILNHDLTEDNLNIDSNWKVLIHLAWALLRDNQILIMDNLTANVNTKTEQLVEEILAKYFMKKTIINITSRLHQIAACDKVFVFEKGRIIEMNEPQILVQDKDGYLAQMYKIDKIDDEDNELD